MNLIILFSVIQSSLGISSPAFQDGQMIPEQYTCEGKNISPPLTIDRIPDKTMSLVVIMDDPDAPHGGFDHWIMFNIPPAAAIRENEASGVQGANGKGNPEYTGPCPPSGIHHYHFKVYALNAKLDLKAGAKRSKVQDKMKGHILASGELIGIYTKKKESLNQK